MLVRVPDRRGCSPHRCGSSLPGTADEARRLARDRSSGCPSGWRPTCRRGLVARISTTPPAKGGSVVEEATRGEANISAQQPSPSEAARLPAPHVDAGRPPDPAGAPSEGSPAALGLIWRVRDRKTFEAFRRRGKRSRSGPVRVTYLPPVEPEGRQQPPRIAYVVGKRVGSAVVRNRMRRRLRGVVIELARDQGSPLAPGAYLIGVDPTAVALSHEELRSNVRAALERVAEDRT